MGRERLISMDSTLNRRRNVMRRAVVILTLVAVVFLFRVPDVRAGGGAALTPPNKTTGPAISATVVVRVPGGETAIRIQKGNLTRAALFFDTRGLVQGCQLADTPTLETSTDVRYIGFMSGWVPTGIRRDLFAGLGPSQQAVISDIDAVACTDLTNGEHILSFTAVIQFATSPLFPPE
jgi:hypothetical protein